MENLKYDSTVTLGHILQIIVIFFTVLGGVWYTAGRQELLLEQNKNIFEKLAGVEVKQQDMEKVFVRRDVSEEHDKLLMDKLEFIGVDIQSIKTKIGLPTDSKAWKSWGNHDN